MSGDAGVTLEQVMDSRERRACRQREHILEYGVPIVSFTINMPGAHKNTSESRFIFHEGLLALDKAIAKHFGQPLFREVYELDTGHEALLGVKAEAKVLKVSVLKLELEHPLGRMFDFDVIGIDGIPVSRESLGHPKRKCLLCGNEAHMCGRSGRHGLDELVRKIGELIEAYLSTDK